MDTKIPDPSSQSRKQRRPFTIHTSGFTPTNAVLASPTAQPSRESKDPKQHSQELLRVASSVPLSTSAHRRCQRRAGRGGTQLPRGVITGACAPVTAPKGPLTSLGCPLLHCPKNTWNKSSLGFLMRPTSLPGADPRKHSGHCKELRAAGQGWRPEVFGVRSPWLLQVLV